MPLLPTPPTAPVPAAPPAQIAASPILRDAFVPYSPPVAAADDSSSTGRVETFDPIGQARMLAEQLPRGWRGTYQSYEGVPAVPVELALDSVVPVGQMVTLRGRISIGGVETPVQGNLNAKSDQLDLLLLGDRLGAGLEPGGAFQGVQGMNLNSWQSGRLTSPGGRLELVPAVLASTPAAAEPAVRGLW